MVLRIVKTSDTIIPFEEESVISEDSKAGLVLVDIINAFCTVGSGNLAPRESSRQVSEMIGESVKLAKLFCRKKWPLLAFLDSHPYPPHSTIIRTHEFHLVPALRWIEEEANVTIRRKDCHDGFIGSIKGDASNFFVDWVKNNNIQTLVVVGVCADMCVMEFVCSSLSAKNEGLLSPLVLYSRGCTPLISRFQLQN